MNNLIDILKDALQGKQICYQPKANGPKYWGTIKSVTSRNVVIESEEKKVIMSAPFDQVFIDAPCIIIPTQIKD